MREQLNEIKALTTDLLADLMVRYTDDELKNARSKVRAIHNHIDDLKKETAMRKLSIYFNEYNEFSIYLEDKEGIADAIIDDAPLNVDSPRRVADEVKSAIANGEIMVQMDGAVWKCE